MKRIARAMCLVMVVAALPTSAWASGDKASESEVAKYAELEAASPEAAAFEGGDAAGTLLFIVVVAAIVVLVYYLLDAHHHAAGPRPAGDTRLAQAPPLFR
jgi:hypothetical protein